MQVIRRRYGPNAASLFGTAILFTAACAPVLPPASGSAVTPWIRIIGTNDFHGALEPRADSAGVVRGGAAHVATAIKRAAAECSPECEVIILDGGDMFQGTPASNLAFGKPVVELFNSMGYAAAALGNHEFDWGVDSLRARMADARYAILGANVTYADGRDVEWIRDDTLVTRGRARIGIIGLSTTQTPTTTRPQNVAHLRFVDPGPVVNARARSLRARGATHVIVVAHIGGFCTQSCTGEVFDLARSITEPVNAIISGHSHSFLDTTVNAIPIVQARSSGRSIDVLDIRAGQATTGSVRNVIATELPADAETGAIVARWTARVAEEFSRPVAEIAAPLARTGNQYALGNLIADAQRVAGGGDVGVMNNGGIRAGIDAGTLTYGELFEVQPFGNLLVRVRMTGTDLITYLAQAVARGWPNAHVSGAEMTYRADGAGSAKLERVTVGGNPVDPARVYSVIMNDFMAALGDGLGPPATRLSVEMLDILDRDAFRTYLLSQPQPVRAPAEVRIRAVQ